MESMQGTKRIKLNMRFSDTVKHLGFSLSLYEVIKGFHPEYDPVQGTLIIMINNNNTPEAM